MLHLPPLITDLAIILGAAALMTLIFKKLKQPVVLGYILAGLVVGPNVSFFPTIIDTKAINIWAEIGVVFLLFGLGLEFSFKKLSSVGGSASITAIVEVIFMSAMGYICGMMLGWNQMDSIFLGAMLCVSSTTIIIRAFDELGMKTRKYATLVFGALIVEDLITILLLVLLSTIAISRQFAGGELMFSVIKLGFFMLIWFLFGIFLIPSFLRWAKNILNSEMLLIISLALCLGMVFFATYVGFSPALGAFVMGSILAETVEGKHIEHLIQPVKDLFGAIFFVSVGILIDPRSLVDNWQVVLIITALTIVGKILTTGFGALLSGQTLKHSVQTGMALSQIGEFSFIIANLGLSLKVTSDFLYPIGVAVSVVTTFTTPYMIKYSEPFASWLEKVLPKRLVTGINNYSSSSQTFFASTRVSSILKDFMIKIILLVMVVLAITFSANKMMGTSKITAFLFSFILSAPFLWAIAKAKVIPNLAEKESRKFHLMVQVLKIFQFLIVAGLLTFLLSFYFSTWIVSTLFLVFSLGAMFVFSSRLASIYQWMEKTFIKNLNNVDESAPKQTPLTPWDAHLALYAVSPNSPYLGKTLEELAIRELYGVSVVMIERGHKKITAPKRDEKLYPLDKISVIGTDEHLALFKAFIEEAAPENPADKHTAEEYVLKGFKLDENSIFIGKTIRDSEVRELTDGLVVGLERNGTRILNPDSLTVLEVEDFVWIVGIKEKIRALIS